MRMQFGLSAFERDKGNFAQLPVVNMFAEEAPTEGQGVVLQSRYGLDAGLSMGNGPVQALFKRDGVQSGGLFGVSGGNLYEGSTVIGAIAGSGPVSIAGNDVALFVAAGAGPYFYNGTLNALAFPDDANVIKVVTGAARAVFLRENSGKFYWTDALETDVEALDFATAESSADRLLDAVFIDDALILFGSETVEFWPNTSDALLPFQPLEGRVLEQGVKATGCATAWNSSFAFIGDDNVIYDPNMQPMSNAGLEEKIKASNDCQLFSFQLDGHEMLALRIDAGTWVRSNRTGTWAQFDSYGLDNWVVGCHAGGVFGSAIDGKTYSFSDTYSGPIERRFRAGIPINGGTLTINNIRLRVNPGQTSFLTGEYANPNVEMRISRDAGQTWGNWKKRSLGKQGQYSKRIEWRGLGMANDPGLLCEFRVTDPVPFAVSGVFINEALGGR